MFGVFAFEVKGLGASALGLAEPSKESGRDDDNPPVLGSRGVDEVAQSSACCTRGKFCGICGGAEIGGGGCGLGSRW